MKEIALALVERVRAGEYRGYDPYDALNSGLLRAMPSKYLKITITQGLVYSPVNLRMLLGIRKGTNPKSLGLVLKGICGLRRSGILGNESFFSLSNDLVGRIRESSSKGYGGYCWGFNFPWQDLTRFSEPYLPTIVITSFMGDALLDLYGITGERDVLHMAEGACEFITSDLNRYENEKGICFSYTPIDNNVVHNASMLGASLLARLGSLTGRAEYGALARKALSFTLSYQREDGSWPYSLYPRSGRERMQVDFHQGFVLDCIMDVIKYVDDHDMRASHALEKGIAFYRDRQFDGGRGLWRYPRRWPQDIHHQAQGVITFSKYYGMTGDEAHLRKAGEILDHTLKYFTKSNGSFLYQRWPLFTNRIEYLRWADAWMVLAFGEYLKVRT